jgi:hypothetical protein
MSANKLYFDLQFEKCVIYLPDRISAVLLGWSGAKYLEKTCPSAALCTTDPTHSLAPDSNPDRRGGKPATNRLNYGTAFSYNPEEFSSGLSY